MTLLMSNRRPLYWKGEATANGGVALMVKREFASSVTYVRRICLRILCESGAFCRSDTNNSYMDQSGRSEEDKNRFYDNSGSKWKLYCSGRF